MCIYHNYSNHACAAAGTIQGYARGKCLCGYYSRVGTIHGNTVYLLLQSSYYIQYTWFHTSQKMGKGHSVSTKDILVWIYYEVLIGEMYKRIRA